MPYSIFLAEDEAIVRNGIRKEIEKHPEFHFLGEAGDGELALSYLQELEPDILITDIRMPFLDGLALSEIVRKKKPWIKVVIISGYDEFEFAQKALSIGVDAYLLKPVVSDEFFEALLRVTEKIEEDRARMMSASGSEKERTMLLERASFLDELTQGVLDTEEVFERAEHFGLRLSSRSYITAEADVHFGEDGALPFSRLQSMLGSLWDSDEKVLCFFKGMDRIAMIIKGSTSEEVSESAYEQAAFLKQGMEHICNCSVTVGIGTPCDRISKLKGSFSDAHKALQLLVGSGQARIMSSEEILNIPVRTESLRNSFGGVLQHIYYAIEEDADRLTEEFLANIGEGSLLSQLYLYYSLSAFDSALREMLPEGAEYGEDEGPEPLLGTFRGTEQLDTASIREYVREMILATVRKLRAFSEDSPVILAKRYIFENYSERSLSLNTVAGRIGFSASHFSSLFANCTGDTFIGYLTKVRMQKAAELLISGDAAVEDVADAVGYGDAKYFRYLFRKDRGMSPKEYRKGGTGHAS